MKGFDLRFIVSTDLELRKKSDTSTTMAGHAAVFNSQSQDLGGWTEFLDPDCFSDALNRDDLECYSLFNHDPNHVLGVTTNGSHRVSQDKTGLYQETDLDMDSVDGSTMAGHIRAGRITRMSFAMLVAPDGSEWDYKNGAVIRTVKRVSVLADTSPVTYAAYQAANVGMRSLFGNASSEIQSLMLRAEHNLPLGKTDYDLLKDWKIRISNLLDKTKEVETPAPAAVRTLDDWKKRFNALK